MVCAPSPSQDHHVALIIRFWNPFSKLRPPLDTKDFMHQLCLSLPMTKKHIPSEAQILPYEQSSTAHGLVLRTRPRLELPGETHTKEGFVWLVQ